MSSSTSPPVNICVITDDNYAIPTTVMLTSLKENRLPQTLYKIHFLYCNLSEIFIQKAKELASPEFELFFHEIAEDAYVKDFQTAAFAQHVSSTALFKFMICELLPELDKVLYMDGDIIVRKDLSELFQTDLGDNLLAAIHDNNQKFHKLQDMEICYDGTYFNSGVMLLNLSLMRKINAPEELMKTYNSLPVRRFQDQDTFNHFCNGRKILLPPKYNISISFKKSYPSELKKQIISPIPARNTELEDSFVLIHFAGTKKPWKYINAPYANVWMYYYNLSPYKNFPIDRELQISEQELKPAFEQCIKKTPPVVAPVPRPEATPKPIDMGVLALLRGAITRNYYRYRLLACITWGKRHRRYAQKKKQCKHLLSSLENAAVTNYDMWRARNR